MSGHEWHARLFRRLNVTCRGPMEVASGKPSPFDFVGRMTAVVAILPVAHEAARAMLPAGLDLAAQDFMPGKRHPLVLILGQQSDVRPRLLPLGADYLEAILAVPFVQLREHGTPPRGPFCYCPRLLLDRRLPIVGRTAAVPLRQAPRPDPDDRRQLPDR